MTTARTNTPLYTVYVLVEQRGPLTVWDAVARCGGAATVRFAVDDMVAKGKRWKIQDQRSIPYKLVPQGDGTDRLEPSLDPADW